MTQDSLTDATGYGMQHARILLAAFIVGRGNRGEFGQRQRTHVTAVLVLSCPGGISNLTHTPKCTIKFVSLVFLPNVLFLTHPRKPPQIYSMLDLGASFSPLVARTSYLCFGRSRRLRISGLSNQDANQYIFHRRMCLRG